MLLKYVLCLACGNMTGIPYLARHLKLIKALSYREVKNIIDIDRSVNATKGSNSLEVREKFSKWSEPV